MFTKVLIANRGEIALRILRACRTLGIGAVVAYSEADRESLAAQLADEAICIGPADAKHSYLCAPAIISAAVVTGCDAIHPGYGFLSEDEAFAEVVRAHGLTFIGPSAEVLERFASKEATRRILSANGLPTIPGSGMLRDEAHALEEAEKIGYPVLIKPSAGGGGKGMRLVRTARELETAFKVSRSEAKAGFGDDSLYLEKYLEDNRHVEIQVAVDRFGNAIHMGERDCSVQRRHQKLIEETPSPALTDAARTDLAERALRAVTAAGYENLGTLEFLVDSRGDAYFIEINCRIQVEHPITELCTGIDMVALQIKIAAGHLALLRPMSFPAATPSSFVSWPRIPPRTSGRRPVRSAPISRPAVPGSGWTRTSIPATKFPPTTTRCSASYRSGRPIGRPRLPAPTWPFANCSSTA
jgi:acetyl-CoA carboxylase biotin carboxylase subunit